MAEQVFVMPDLGEGLEEGRIVGWLVAEGDPVELDQPFVEVETAKAAVEIPSPFTGTVVALHGTVGEDVPVGDPLATFDVTGGAVAAADIGRRAGPEPRSLPADGAPPVRRLAKGLGVDLVTIAGTGPEGRITEDDVRAAGQEASAHGTASRSRSVIAANLERQASIPQVTTFRTVDCSALQSFRADVGLSPLPIVVAAVARTATLHPLLTAAWGGEEPVMRRASTSGSRSTATAGWWCRSCTPPKRKGCVRSPRRSAVWPTALAPAPWHPRTLTGATIAVSNTGSYGSEAGTPILSPGTSVTLAFGVIEDRALVVDGAVVARPAATISLTFDHRVLDGAAAGRALTDLVALLQSPERLGELPR